MVQSEVRTPLGLSISSVTVIRKRDSVASTQGWGILPGQDALVDGATGLLRCASFFKQINKSRDQQAYSRSNVKMARLLHNLLLLTVGLTLKIRVMGYWSLIYGYCALCTGVALIKLGWNIILRPTTTFQWTVRETPPACLNDTSLGTHCYVRIKVRDRWKMDRWLTVAYMKACILKYNCIKHVCSFIFFFEIWTLHQMFVSDSLGETNEMIAEWL